MEEGLPYPEIKIEIDRDVTDDPEDSRLNSVSVHSNMNVKTEPVWEDDGGQSGIMNGEKQAESRDSNDITCGGSEKMELKIELDDISTVCDARPDRNRLASLYSGAQISPSLTHCANNLETEQEHCTCDERLSPSSTALCTDRSSTTMYIDGQNHRHTVTQLTGGNTASRMTNKDSLSPSDGAMYPAACGGNSSAGTCCVRDFKVELVTSDSEGEGRQLPHLPNTAGSRRKRRTVPSVKKKKPSNSSSTLTKQQKPQNTPVPRGGHQQQLTLNMIKKEKAEGADNSRQCRVYQCGVCHEKLEKSQRRKHMSQHKVTGFSCGNCLKVFRNRSNLNKHQQLHTGRKPFSCDQCTLEFALASYLKKHKQRAHDAKRKRKIMSKDGLPDGVGSRACRESKSTSSSEPFSADKTDHKPLQSAAHHPPESSQSSGQTSMISDGDSSTQSPVFTSDDKVESSENLDTDQTCASLSVYPVSIIKNECAISPEDDTPEIIKCGVCNEIFHKFQQEEHVARHRVNNPNKVVYRCKICPEQFESRLQLAEHGVVHAGEKPFACDLCPSQFASLSYLKTHKNRVHCAKKPYRCALCPAAFCVKFSLQSHMKMHSEDRPLQCDLCSSTFKYTSSLVAHKRTHMQVNPFKCEQCPAEFKCAGNLRQHRRTHSDERPYRCEFCNAAFKHSSTLKLHTRTHTGEKPYQCDQCPKAFTRSKFLDSHRRTHLRRKSVNR